MKNIVYAFLVGVIFSSCQSIKFDRYPGEALQNFPEEFRGKYSHIMKTGSSYDTINVIVSKDAYTIFDRKETAIDFLDSNHVFSKYNDNYFLFLKDEGYWSGYAVKKSKNELVVLSIALPNKGDNTQKVKKVSKYFADVKCVKTLNVLNTVDCTAKMDEKSLLKYIKKNKRNKMKLIQVKE